MSVKIQQGVDSNTGRSYHKNRKKIKLVLAKSAEDFHEVRCDECNALFFKSTGLSGTLQMKCRKCGKLVALHFG
jgi:hypothetical protein